MGDGGNMGESTQLIRPMYGGKVTDGCHFPHVSPISPQVGGWGISLIGALSDIDSLAINTLRVDLTVHNFIVR